MMLAFSATVFGAARASPRCCKQLSFDRMGSKSILQLVIFQLGRSNRNRKCPSLHVANPLEKRLMP